MPRGSKKSSFNFGYTLSFMLLVLLAALAVLLLIPQLRELRKKRQLEAEETRRLEMKLALRAENTRRNHELRRSRTATPAERRQAEAAITKVAREKFNLVSEGDLVYTFPPLDCEK